METIISLNNSMISLNAKTTVRASVIAQRTQSDVMGIVKAMMIENLKAQMMQGVAHFAFCKKDGSIREAWGTIQNNITKAKTNGRGVNREQYATCAFFDIEKGEWRSFRWETLVKVF